MEGSKVLSCLRTAHSLRGGQERRTFSRFVSVGFRKFCVVLHDFWNLHETNNFICVFVLHVLYFNQIETKTNRRQLMWSTAVHVKHCIDVKHSSDVKQFQWMSVDAFSFRSACVSFWCPVMWNTEQFMLFRGFRFQARREWIQQERCHSLHVLTRDIKDVCMDNFRWQKVWRLSQLGAWRNSFLPLCACEGWNSFLIQ